MVVLGPLELGVDHVVVVDENVLQQLNEVVVARLLIESVRVGLLHQRGEHLCPAAGTHLLRSGCQFEQRNAIVLSPSFRLVPDPRQLGLLAGGAVRFECQLRVVYLLLSVFSVIQSLEHQGC